MQNSPTHSLTNRIHNEKFTILIVCIPHRNAHQTPTLPCGLFSTCRRALAGLLTLTLTTSTRQSRCSLCFEAHIEHYFSALSRCKEPACTSVARTPANAVGARCQRLYGSYLMWRAALTHARSANAARNTLSQRYISTYATEARSGDVRRGDRCISMRLECRTVVEWQARTACSSSQREVLVVLTLPC